MIPRHKTDSGYRKLWKKFNFTIRENISKTLNSFCCCCCFFVTKKAKSVVHLIDWFHEILMSPSKCELQWTWYPLSLQDHFCTFQMPDLYWHLVGIRTSWSWRSRRHGPYSMRPTLRMAWSSSHTYLKERPWVYFESKLTHLAASLNCLLSSCTLHSHILLCSLVQQSFPDFSSLTATHDSVKRWRKHARTHALI